MRGSWRHLVMRDPGQEPIVYQRLADALRGAQARENVGIRLHAEGFRKAGDAAGDRCAGRGRVGI
jgi:hypothetical protein